MYCYLTAQHSDVRLQGPGDKQCECDTHSAHNTDSVSMTVNRARMTIRLVRACRVVCICICVRVCARDVWTHVFAERRTHTADTEALLAGCDLDGVGRARSNEQRSGARLSHSILTGVALAAIRLAGEAPTPPFQPSECQGNRQANRLRFANGSLKLAWDNFRCHPLAQKEK